MEPDLNSDFGLTDTTTVSIVVPVYFGASSLPELVRRVAETLEHGPGYEVILVDDGSRDESWSVICQIGKASSAVRGIRLSRNFGQHNALLAGVRHARGSVTITIDDDLQNPPEMIPRLLSTLAETGSDVVYGVPTRVRQSFTRRLAGHLIRSSLASGLGVAEAPTVSSFRAFKTQLRDGFDQEVGTGVSIDALLAWSAQSYSSIDVEHDPRAHGTSNYSVRKLMRFALDTVTGYSAKPLQMASVLGLVTAVIGFAALLWAVGRPIITGTSVQGFPFLASTIALFSGVQLLTLGIMGGISRPNAFPHHAQTNICDQRFRGSS